MTKTVVQLDLRAKVIIFIYYLSMFLNSVNWNAYVIYKTINEEYEDHKKEKFELYAEFIDVSTVEFIVIILQVIVFDMYSLYCTLTSMSRQQNDTRQRCISIIKYFVIMTTTVSISVSLFFIYFGAQCEGEELYCYDKQKYDALVWSMYMYRLAVSLTMLGLFLFLFVFFFKLKKAKLAKERKDF